MVVQVLSTAIGNRYIWYCDSHHQLKGAGTRIEGTGPKAQRVQIQILKGAGYPQNETVPGVATGKPEWSTGNPPDIQKWREKGEIFTGANKGNKRIFRRRPGPPKAGKLELAPKRLTETVIKIPLRALRGKFHRILMGRPSLLRKTKFPWGPPRKNKPH